MDYVVVGKIVNTRGIKGELKIVSSTSFKEERYKIGNKITLLNPFDQRKEEVIISSYFVYKDFDYLVFKGKEDINLVEKYKGWLIIAKKKELSSEEEFYYDDLKGLDVFFKEEFLGKVEEVIDLNKKDMLRIKKKDGKYLLVLFMNQFVETVDLENKKIILKNIEGLL